MLIKLMILIKLILQTCFTNIHATRTLHAKISQLIDYLKNLFANLFKVKIVLHLFSIKNGS